MNTDSLTDIAYEFRSRYENLKNWNENPLASLYRDIQVNTFSNPDFAVQMLWKNEGKIDFIYKGKRYFFDARHMSVFEA